MQYSAIIFVTAPTITCEKNKRTVCTASICSLPHAHLVFAKVETLCANSLAEVGVAVGDFVEALEASRLSQDISTAVYQQLVALDDFVTFKKLMVSVKCTVQSTQTRHVDRRCFMLVTCSTPRRACKAAISLLPYSMYTTNHITAHRMSVGSNRVLHAPNPMRVDFQPT